MIRPSSRFLSPRFATAIALVALSLPVVNAAAQQQDAPAQDAAPSAPAPAAAPSFPPVDPANFTATSPTKEAVASFLQDSWGYDDNRMWQVQAILKTAVDGVSKVIVLVDDKTGKQKPGQLEFFAFPDGKHILVVGDDGLIPFAAHPFTEARELVKKNADGPYRGSALNDLEIVEFADFQCPHCKEAQANMDKLAVDFPKARIIFQNYPLPQHPAAAGAAAAAVCVAKLGGSDAFFTYAAAVFDGQDGLSTADGATLTLNSAITKAGLDPVKVNACAATKEATDKVEASKKLAGDLGINQTPTLVVNGRLVPASAPYDTLKQIILYQAKIDGVTAQ